MLNAMAKGIDDHQSAILGDEFDSISAEDRLRRLDDATAFVQDAWSETYRCVERERNALTKRKWRAQRKGKLIKTEEKGQEGLKSDLFASDLENIRGRLRALRVQAAALYTDQEIPSITDTGS